MTELKPDSQTVRTVQVQPGQKKARTSRAAKAATVQEAAIAAEASGAVAAETPANIPEEPPKRKRRTSSTKTTQAKSQATSRSKQTASTQVKLAWEVPATTIGSRFAQLENELQHLKGQATEVQDQIATILSEMEALKQIAQEVDGETGRRGDRETRKWEAVQLPNLDPIRQPIHPEVLMEPLATPAAEDQAPEINASQVKTPPEPLLERVKQVPAQRDLAREKERGDVLPERRYRTQSRLPSPTPQSAPIPSFSPSPRLPVSLSSACPAPRRRSTLRFYGQQFKQQALRLPRKRLFLVLDNVLWVLAAAGLQYLLKLLAVSAPFLGGPVAGLIVVPAFFAAYAAFFSPNANAIALYRLLLVTLGLFIGGKL